MNNRSGGPRSFYTVKRSNREDRLRRRMQGRVTLLAICAVLLLLAVSGMILFVCNLVYAAPQEDPSNPLHSDIRFQTITLTANDTKQGNLIAVNQAHVYTFPATRLEFLDSAAKGAYQLATYRTKLDGVSYPYMLNLSKEQLMLPTAAEALNQMLTQCYITTGDSAVTVHETYRSDKDQQATGSSVAAGYSEHHTGLIVRLQVWNAGGTYSDLSEEQRPWIFQNCHNYGFIQRYPAGKTGITGVSNYTECFRYVGVAHATYIKQNNLCLEEYLDLLKKNHSATSADSVKMLSVDTNGDGQAEYGIYYVPAKLSGDLTAVPVPQSLPYEVSGDNMGGFVVTVNLK